MVAATALVDSV